jgi:hypothetical protein
MHAFVILVCLITVVGILLTGIILSSRPLITVIVAESAAILWTFEIGSIVVQVSLSFWVVGGHRLVAAVRSWEVLLLRIHLSMLGSTLLHCDRGGWTSSGGSLGVKSCVIIVWITILKLKILSLVIFGHL